MVKIVNGNIIRETLPSTSFFTKRRHSLSSLGDLRGHRDFPKYPWGNNNHNKNHNRVHQNHLEREHLDRENKTSMEKFKDKFKPLQVKAVLYGMEIKCGYVFLGLLLTFLLGGINILLIYLLTVYLGTQFNHSYHDQMKNNYPHEGENQEIESIQDEQTSSGGNNNLFLNRSSPSLPSSRDQHTRNNRRRSSLCTTLADLTESSNNTQMNTPYTYNF
ncbi:hypothetical protein PPL_02525 [Heterostelium album PN500]|uniref:Uncharacterized protein n=1 Tax=Heterostelium pallidum (strain ATCC 26659 / Pp 5 / PN500) TaxID=670386 RepID=D3B2B6_HETP5|nr:hypothetical protein PPL_02525 [Heterostelium album PN500]EFA84491.1 hypothetical protein PPL_02525 [Heterostelium album PN500]|eukprot:XP_020436605.1 hypothetical protein PPL_02525 [Heterostelium album PN500]